MQKYDWYNNKILLTSEHMHLYAIMQNKRENNKIIKFMYIFTFFSSFAQSYKKKNNGNPSEIHTV